MEDIRTSVPPCSVSCAQSSPASSIGGVIQAGVSKLSRTDHCEGRVGRPLRLFRSEQTCSMYSNRVAANNFREIPLNSLRRPGPPPIGPSASVPPERTLDSTERKSVSSIDSRVRSGKQVLKKRTFQRAIRGRTVFQEPVPGPIHRSGNVRTVMK